MRQWEPGGERCCRDRPSLENRRTGNGRAGPSGIGVLTRLYKFRNKMLGDNGSVHKCIPMVR